MLKYKDGDQVRVRHDLKRHHPYAMDPPRSYVCHDALSEMVKFAGKVVTISRTTRVQYRIKEDGEKWLWTDGMFEEVVE